MEKNVQKKLILVTGANGYIGRHVVKELVNNFTETVEVIASDHHEHSKALVPVTYIKFDLLRDSITPEMVAALGGGKIPDTVLHLTWRSGFDHDSVNHILDLSQHYKFAITLIQSGVRKLAFAGSFREYGTCNGKVAEDHSCDSSNNYALAKNTLREALNIYRKSHPFIFLWLRFFTPYGDDKNNNSLLSKILKWETDGRTEFPFTDGLEQYDYIHITKLAEYTAKTIIQDSVTGIINICSGRPIYLKDVVNTFIKENHLAIRPKFGAYKARGYDSRIIYGDNSKLLSALGKKKEEQ